MALCMVTGRTPVKVKIAGDRRVEGVDAQRRAGHHPDRRIIPRREPAAWLPVDGEPERRATATAAWGGGCSHGALTVWGAYLYFWARVVYVFLYAAGIPLIRSLVWNVATFGIFLFVAALLSR
jgi:hypothetical protein